MKIWVIVGMKCEIHILWLLKKKNVLRRDTIVSIFRRFTRTYKWNTYLFFSTGKRINRSIQKRSFIKYFHYYFVRNTEHIKIQSYDLIYLLTHLLALCSLVYTKKKKSNVFAYALLQVITGWFSTTSISYIVYDRKIEMIISVA